MEVEQLCPKTCPCSSRLPPSLFSPLPSSLPPLFFSLSPFPLLSFFPSPSPPPFSFLFRVGVCQVRPNDTEGWSLQDLPGGGAAACQGLAGSRQPPCAREASCTQDLTEEQPGSQVISPLSRDTEAQRHSDLPEATQLVNARHHPLPLPRGLPLWASCFHTGGYTLSWVVGSQAGVGTQS